MLLEGDDVADALEEAAFLVTLVPSGASSKQAVDELQRFADLITRGAPAGGGHGVAAGRTASASGVRAVEPTGVDAGHARHAPQRRPHRVDLRALIRWTGNHRLAWVAYRRLMLGFAKSVYGWPTIRSTD
jgi:hypothetical protein